MRTTLPLNLPPGHLLALDARTHVARRACLKTVCGAWLWFLVISWAIFFSHSASAADRPHLFLPHADQARVDALGPYGNPQIRTPAITQLATAGVRFNNSFCSFPVCTPSRYS